MNRNVFLLGMVSLFTDLSSQMIYPLVPQFLTELGASKSIIGIIEGLADATASLFRVVFGRWSDRVGKRKWFVFAGYGLATLAKPFLYLATVWGHVLGVRFMDRLGKAIRNPARDALIAASVPAEKRGQAFGRHRAMDKIGAFGGPLIAMGILALSPDNLRLVFLLAVIPGLLALGFIPFVREQAFTAPTKKVSAPLGASSAFRWFLIANLIFSLGNSSNAFLLLKASDTGITVFLLPVLWMLYNAVSAIASPILGKLSDQVGRRTLIFVSFVVYAALYAGFAIADQAWQMWVLFAGYGIYYGLSNGVYKAYIADLVPQEQLGSAYGLYTTVIGIALFPASLIAGVIWDLYGSVWTFGLSAGFSILALLIMFAARKR